MLLDSFAFCVSVLRKKFAAFCTQRLSEMDVTYGQLYIILFLGKRESCSPKDIAAALKLDAGHLNRTLTKMVQEGLVVQQKSAVDKRAHVIQLTDKGRQVFEKSRNLFQEWDETALEVLTESEKKTLMQLIRKVAFHKNEDVINNNM